jgi:PDZ domain-containing protein
MTFFEPDFDAARRNRRRKTGLGFLAVATLSLFALVALPTPYIIERPGPTFDILAKQTGKDIISTTDVVTYPTKGQLHLLTVSVVGNRDQTPNWLELGLAWLDPNQSIVPIDQVFPLNQTAEEAEAESTALMEISQQDAIAAALLELGYQVPGRVYISQVTAGAAASKKLIAGDFVTEVNDFPVSSVAEVRAEVEKYTGSSGVKIEILRSGQPLSYQIIPKKDPEGNYRLGILAGYKFDFPIDIKLELADVGGPSGGLMFALGIIDRLTEGELTGGQVIAGTGTITPSGQVGPIGGITHKLVAADRIGARLFFTPAENCQELAGVRSNARVVKVSTLDDALAALKIIESNGNTDQLPSCSSN